MIGQGEVANIASYPSKLLYFDDKRNKCKYLIDTGTAVSTNRATDTNSLPLVAVSNTTINTYGTCKRIVDDALNRDYAWTFIVP